MDEIDCRLLRLLQEDAKSSYADIGEQVGLSVSSVSDRIRKLQATGVINGTVALLSARAIGLDLCAFMQVLTERPGSEEPFLDFVAETPEIQECHHITGEFSYLLKLRVRNSEHFESLLKQIKSLPGVARTYTLVALSSPKETTALPLTGCGRQSHITGAKGVGHDQT